LEDGGLNSGHFISIVLEAGSPGSRFLQIWHLVRAFLVVHRWLSLTITSHGGEKREEERKGKQHWRWGGLLCFLKI
jgi:hypothetical protein